VSVLLGSSVSRAEIERIARSVVERRLHLGGSGGPAKPPKLVVNISARHVHLTPAAVEQLFGSGHTLQIDRKLYQDGEFAAAETVSVIGPRRRMLPNVRVLGPCRDYNQVELAFTDGISLGIELPVRRSGDHRDTPGCYLVGPAGMIQLQFGVIRAERHVHMGDADTLFYGVKHGDRMNLRVTSTCPTTLENLLVRHDRRYKLEVHLDTDEGNACDLEHATNVELVKRV
jgi:putative phosphotransacetylase